MKTNIFFFKSSRKSDKLTQLTICSATKQRAYALAVIHFKSVGYKGTPRFLIATH